MSIVRPGHVDERPLLADETVAPLGSSRAGVLARLRASAGALSAPDVADLTGLHVNTARFHLDALVAAGWAERAVAARHGPGRPRIVYAVRPRSTGTRSYGLLAGMLAGLVGELDGDGSRAAEAGRTWGRHLVGSTPDPGRQDGARARLDRLLRDVGFEQEPGADADERLIRHCPFLEVATEHPSVVCGLHRGLVQGALEELRAPTEVVLEPFAEPGLCRLRLRAGSP